MQTQARSLRREFYQEYLEEGQTSEKYSSAVLYVHLSVCPYYVHKKWSCLINMIAESKNWAMYKVDSYFNKHIMTLSNQSSFLYRLDLSVTAFFSDLIYWPISFQGLIYQSICFQDLITAHFGCISKYHNIYLLWMLKALIPPKTSSFDNS